MNRRGFTTIELIVLLSSMIAALGGAYLGADYVGTPAKPDANQALVIDIKGEGRMMELEAGKHYDAMITSDGRIIVKEKP